MKKAGDGAGEEAQSLASPQPPHEPDANTTTAAAPPHNAQDDLADEEKVKLRAEYAKQKAHCTEIYMQYLDAERNVSQRERKLRRMIAAAENAIEEADLAKAAKAPYNIDAVVRFTSAFKALEEAECELADAADAHWTAAWAFEVWQANTIASGSVFEGSVRNTLAQIGGT